MDFPKQTVKECCEIRAWLESCGDSEEEPTLTEFYEISFAYGDLSNMPLCSECLKFVARRT